jgi:hypothetical protein
MKNPANWTNLLIADTEQPIDGKAVTHSDNKDIFLLVPKRFINSALRVGWHGHATVGKIVGGQQDTADRYSR